MATKLLVSLLGAQERTFKQYIDKLEHVCLRPGVDIRLSAEIVTAVRERTRALGFDPKDTTTKELYQLLKARLEVDDDRLKKALKIEGAAPEKIAKTLASTAHKLSTNERSLSLTSSGVKKILKAVPPRKTMRALKYRSLNSVIKRVDPRLLYAVACIVEDKSWSSQVHAKMRRLDAKDIKWQQVSCLSLPVNWYQKLASHFESRGAFLSNSETGLVCVSPVIETSDKGSTVLSLGMLLNAAQEISIESLPYRREAFDQGYSTILPELAHSVRPKLVSMHGLQPSWRVVHELMGKGYIQPQSPEVEFVIGETQWQSVEMKLSSIVPEFDFWVGSHFLGVDTATKPVSFHIIDVAMSLLAGSEYGSQSVTHFEASLWNELTMRYLQQDVMSHTLVNQLRQNNSESL